MGDTLGELSRDDPSEFRELGEPRRDEGADDDNVVAAVAATTGALVGNGTAAEVVTVVVRAVLVTEIEEDWRGFTEGGATEGGTTAGAARGAISDCPSACNEPVRGRTTGVAKCIG